MAPRHTMRRFSASLTQRKTKSGVFACFKGRGGNREGRGTLTEMRSVGDGTLRMQQNEAVFIKKPSETPYYENLAEERCASEATLWTLRLRIYLEAKEHNFAVPGGPCWMPALHLQENA